MPKRRGAGEGSIFQRADGRWCAQVTVGRTAAGKPRYKLLYGSTRSTVSEALKKTLREQQVGLDVAPERQTVAYFLADWLQNTVKLKNREQTYRSYEWIVRTHLTPAIGHLALSKVTPQRLQAFINERHATGLSAATIKHINATLRAALSQAQRWQLVHQNAAKLVSLPRAERYKPTVLDGKQAKAFLAATANHKHEALFSVALSLGLRRGEAIALRWTDVDFAAGTLRVNQSLERVKGGGTRLAEPKSHKAKRTLRLPQVCVASLLRQKARQDIAKEWAGKTWKEGDFIFTTRIGTPLQPEMVTREFNAALVAAKLPAVRFHDLRHSCASLLLALGVHPKLVQETLGHSTYQLTMDTYSHMIPELRNEVADRMDQILGPKTPETVNETVSQQDKTIH